MDKLYLKVITHRGKMFITRGVAPGTRRYQTTASLVIENRIKNVFCEAESEKLGVSN
jgi:hypothetical protein